MRYVPLFLLVILLGSASSAFAERGGGRDFNRGGERNFQRQDFDRRHENWQHRDNWGGNINVNPQVIIPQGPGYYNNDPFPDDTEEDQIYQENLQN